MKLLFCPDCNHVFSLSRKKMRSCDCGKVSGMYVDEVNAEVNGAGYSLAIGNGSLAQAIAIANKPVGAAVRNRSWFINNARVTYCWVRPHTGIGNPHSKVVKGGK